MHLENMHSMIEKLTECTKSAIENDQSYIGKYPISDVVDMIKDLSEAEYYGKISKAMDKADKEQEEEDKYMLQRMKEEYGEDEGQRYYNEYRYASGRFAPKGRGTRRRYTEPRYHMPPEVYGMYPEEYYRDIDRMDGRMYYNGGDSSSNRGQSSSSPGGSRNYSDGYNDGNRRGYDDGYSKGDNDGYTRGYEEGRRSNIGNTRDYREGRSGRSRRNYMETKENKPDNSPETKQAKMRELEKYMNELSSDVTEMISDASQEERNLLKNKLQNLQSKIQ